MPVVSGPLLLPAHGESELYCSAASHVDGEMICGLFSLGSVSPDHSETADDKFLTLFGMATSP